jgi:hypothetical protein
VRFFTSELAMEKVKIILKMVLATAANIIDLAMILDLGLIV